jgi:cysteine desulfurase
MSFWRPSQNQSNRVYADAAAATPLSKNAQAELLRLLDVYGNAGGLHSEAVVAQQVLEESRTKIAEAIGAHADEIIFTASGTEANNLGIAGVLRPLLQQHGELHAVTSAIEHTSILEPLFALEKEGLKLTILQIDSEGLVSSKELAAAITEKTVLVSIQMVNSEVGTIEPIQELAKEIRMERKVRKDSQSEGKTWPSGPERANGGNFSDLPLILHTDASQAPLWLNLKVEKLGVDLLTLDAQKIMGPKGVGALFAKRGTNLEPQILGGGQEGGMRSGTPNTPLVGAFAVALEDAQKNAEANAQKITIVRDYCFAEIKKLIPEAILNGPAMQNRIANNINISIPNLDAQMAVIALNVKGVAASTRSACDVGGDEPSHVIQALGIPKELAGTAIRFTFLPTATKADAKHIAESLYKVSALYAESYPKS